MTSTRRVLVVDDNQSNRDLLTRRLRASDMETAGAESGIEALRVVERGGVDLVLLDVMMPGLSGLEVLERIRQRHDLNELPVIMVTALNDSAGIVESLEAGANDYVTKPIDYPVLLARVRSQLRLKHLSDVKDQFLRIASHDLKNPLASISGGAALLQKLAPVGGTVSVEAGRLIDAMVSSSQRMRRIVEDFLDFQALEDGQLSLSLAATDLNAVLGSIVRADAPYAQEKGIELGTELDPTLPPVHIDESKITQIVENLIGNAIKYSPSGTRTVVRSRLEAGAVLVEIVDGGPGLTEGDLERVFRSYSRLSNRPTGDEKSTGLGLAISKHIAEMHDGEVGVRNNTPDPGATFWVRLPVDGEAPARS